jgi:uncharacterized protein
VNRDPGFYSFPIWKAVASSSSAPIYFDPFSSVNGYNITTRLVDGGIVANNPSFYAYLYAKHFKNHKKVRIISLGTGEPPKSH